MDASDLEFRSSLGYLLGSKYEAGAFAIVAVKMEGEGPPGVVIIEEDRTTQITDMSID
jgi:hypothetical protein